MISSRSSLGLRVGSVANNPPANAGDLGSIPGLGRFPGEGNGNPLQCSCLENLMDRGGAWWAAVHGVAKKSNMTEWLNNNSKIITAGNFGLILLGTPKNWIKHMHGHSYAT